MSFCEDNESFETWLGEQCTLVRSDLRHKHKRMKESAFVFLRATYFRWAKTIALTCPAWPDAPVVLAVGDIHIENYGVWRDSEGRLVWGVNDFDEASTMPYYCDLVRLVTSAMLAPKIKLASAAIAENILSGYQDGLANPQPVLLDRRQVWMRRAVMCSPKKRKKFWDEIDDSETDDPPSDVVDALKHSLPKGAAVKRYFKRRKIGGGGLGKPRFGLLALWQDGEIVREAKAETASAWHWARQTEAVKSQAMKLAWGPHRSPDHYLRLRDGYFVRRLAPDNRKIELKDLKASDRRLPQMLKLMGQELGSLHAATVTSAITADLAKREAGWLLEAAECAALAVKADFHEWKART